jgi:uncharacterized protein (TIGR02466 family)
LQHFEQVTTLDISNIMKDATLHHCFITPVMSYVWPDSDELNVRLKELILDEERADQGVRGDYSNVGGWHSKVNLHERDDENVKILLSRVDQMVNEVTRRTIELPDEKWRISYEIEAWANINRFGDYNMPHSHTSSWAVVYYVEAEKIAPPKSRSGVMELYDPRPAATLFPMPGEFFNHRFFVYPVPGLMVLFPAWLTHFVNPYYGTGERISIACNIVLTEVSYF